MPQPLAMNCRSQTENTAWNIRCDEMFYFVCYLTNVIDFKVLQV
jgi:hypothetical protein